MSADIVKQLQSDIAMGPRLHSKNCVLVAANVLEEAAAEIVRLRGEVERALAYLGPHLNAGTFAAPDWAIKLASILTGGDGCGTPIAPAEAKVDACNCPAGISKRDPEKHAPNCPVRTLPCRTLINPFDTSQPADGGAVAGVVCGYAPGMSQVYVRVEAGALPAWLELGTPVTVSTTPPAAQVQQEAVVMANMGDSEAQFIADGERLNCPACGGSGHVDDAHPAGDALGADDVGEIISRDKRVWALAALAEKCGAVKDEGESGLFWTLTLGDFYKLEAALRPSAG